MAARHTQSPRPPHVKCPDPRRPRQPHNPKSTRLWKLPCKTGECLARGVFRFLVFRRAPLTPVDPCIRVIHSDQNPPRQRAGSSARPRKTQPSNHRGVARRHAVAARWRPRLHCHPKITKTRKQQRLERKRQRNSRKQGACRLTSLPRNARGRSPS